ncbi:MAG: hypothetical protein AAGA44_16820, partial [Pseudomonadota bacterium]
RGNMAPVLAAEWSTYDRDNFLTGSPDPDDTVRLRFDDELMGLLAQGYDNSRATRFTLQMMQRNASAVIEAIEATGMVE